MKREQFKRIINILNPSMDIDKIKITKTYYRTYLYVIYFTYETSNYELRMYMVDMHAEINKIHIRTVINRHGEPVELTDVDNICAIHELPEEEQTKIYNIIGE